MCLSAKGFQFVKNTGPKTPIRIGDITNLPRGNAFIVGKYWNNRLICVYPSLLVASEKTLINQGNISESILKGYKAGGFIFKKIL